MKSNMIAKGLMTAAVAGLIAGAIAPAAHATDAKAPAPAKKDDANKCCGKDGCDGKCEGKGKDGKHSCKAKHSCKGKAGEKKAGEQKSEENKEEAAH